MSRKPSMLLKNSAVPLRVTKGRFVRHPGAIRKYRLAALTFQR